MSNNKLREIRVDKGLSQLQLSILTEITPQAISNIENNKVYVYPGWKKRVAEALQVPEEEIFPDESEV